MKKLIEIQADIPDSLLAIFYVADDVLNQFMKALGVKENNKYFVTSYIVELNSAVIDAKDKEEYFMNNFIDVVTHCNYWIPAIQYCGVIYHHKSAKVLSNGEKIMFL